MKRTLLLTALVGATIAGAPIAAQNASELLKGGAIGAGAGALGGAVLPGVSVGAGALVGAAGGTAITVLDKHGRHAQGRFYHDRYGRRYILDRDGNRVYR